MSSLRATLWYAVSKISYYDRCIGIVKCVIGQRGGVVRGMYSTIRVHRRVLQHVKCRTVRKPCLPDWLDVQVYRSSEKDKERERSKVKSELSPEHF